MEGTFQASTLDDDGLRIRFKAKGRPYSVLIHIEPTDEEAVALGSPVDEPLESYPKDGS